MHGPWSQKDPEVALEPACVSARPLSRLARCRVRAEATLSPKGNTTKDQAEGFGHRDNVLQAWTSRRAPTSILLMEKPRFRQRYKEPKFVVSVNGGAKEPERLYGINSHSPVSQDGRDGSVCL